MNKVNGVALLPVASLIELLGVLTLLTNEGSLVPKVDLGFSIPAVLPADIQGIALLVIGGGLTFYSVQQMQ